jgi:ATP-binding cassette subfamily F protein uup
MSIIDVSNLQKSYGPTTLLDGVTFTIEEEAKVGFVGMNGCGKSTLFKIVAGLETKDSGNISFKKGASVGYLAQDPHLDESRTINEEIETALKAIREKVSRYDRINELLSSATDRDSQKLLEEHGEIHSWLEHHGGWNTDYRIETVLTHLKIKDKNQPISVLSGGWRKRVAMAKLILQSPDLLLLDEPTNHLDAETTEWLEGYLKSYPGALMLITHDRYFLDNVVKQMFELEKGKITCYSGGYSKYLVDKGDRLLQEDRVQSRLLNLFRREEEWMSRGPKARSTKQKARIDRFNELEEKTKTSVQKGLNLEFQMDHRLGGTILETVYLTQELRRQTDIQASSASV